MDVHVDEAGGDDLVAGVDDAVAVAGRGFVGGDAAVADEEVAGAVEALGGVEEAGVSDE
jgi:hypothetical protein